MIAAFGPVWILTAVGYAVRRFGAFDADIVVVLSRFVYYLAMPAALFLTLARTPLSGFEGRGLIAFGVSTAVVLGSGWLVSARWFHRPPGQQAIWAMSAGYVNSANLGIPIALQVLGNVRFLVDVVLLQNLVVLPIIMTALDRSREAGGRFQRGRLASLPIRSPVILACVLGAIASAVGYRPTSVLETTLALLSAAAVPAGLVALGASLRRAADSGLDAPLLEIALITTLKLIAQPVVAFLLGAFVLNLSHAELLAVVVCSGLPAAQNTFIFAQEYRVAESLASRAVLVTTLFSLGTLAIAAELIGRH